MTKSTFSYCFSWSLLAIAIEFCLSLWIPSQVGFRPDPLSVASVRLQLPGAISPCTFPFLRDSHRLSGDNRFLPFLSSPAARGVSRQTAIPSTAHVLDSSVG
jgi:hypothetical protein